MTDYTHLAALDAGLSHERARLAAATGQQEQALRTEWVAQIEKELADEYERHGILPAPEMTADELAAELSDFEA
jgi:hypothetical protein